MTRNTILLIFLALFAGTAAGLGAQALKSAPTPAAPDNDELAELRAEMDSLRARLDDRDREIDLGLRESLARLSKLESEVDQAIEDSNQSAPPDQVAAAAQHRVQVAGEPVGGRVVAGSPGMARGMIALGRGGKAMELLKLPEDERWAKIREDLSLDAYQESELKAIGEELQKEMQDMLKFDPASGQMSGKLDVAKMMKTRQDAQERVKNLLSKEQYEKYNSGGYGAAMGLGSTAVSVTYSSVSEPREQEGK